MPWFSGGQLFWAGGHFEKATFSAGSFLLMEIKARRWKWKQFSVQDRLSTNIYCDKFEEISDLKMFPECFRGTLKTLWQTTFGTRAANCPLLP